MTISNLQRRNQATCFRQKNASPPTVLAVNCFQHPQPSEKYKSKTVRPNPSESVSPPIRKTDGHRRRSIIRALVIRVQAVCVCMSVCVCVCWYVCVSVGMCVCECVCVCVYV